MSTRSSAVPRVRKRQPSSRTMTLNTSPDTMAMRSRTYLKNTCGPRTDAAARRSAKPCQLTFSASHTSAERFSRAPRAFSRAAWTDAVIDDGDSWSNASRSTTVSTVTVASSSSTPMTPSRPRSTRSWSVPGSSCGRVTCTSSMRAVASARSTYRPIQYSDSASLLSTGLAPAVAVAAGRSVGCSARRPADWQRAGSRIPAHPTLARRHRPAGRPLAR